MKTFGLVFSILVTTVSAQYQMLMNAFIEGYSPMDSRTVYENLHMAKLGCDREFDCGGITREPNGDFTLRKGSNGMVKMSNVGEVSYIKGNSNQPRHQMKPPTQQMYQNQQQHIEEEEVSALDMLPDLASLMSSL